MEELVKILKEKKYKISFAESCTGGYLASSLTDISGSSEVFEKSFVVYSENAKKDILNVSQDTLDKYSVYSEEIAKEMVVGLKNISNANVCISVTGLADSNDYIFNDKIIKAKSVFIGIIINNEIYIYNKSFSTNTKHEFKEKTLDFIVENLKKPLKKL